MGDKERLRKERRKSLESMKGGGKGELEREKD